jgi:polyhydroxyalkanoate synthesis regulator phasin
MAPDDMFKKYQEAGADFLEEARTRAEEFLRELAKASGATQKQAQDAFEEMFEGSRKGTEQVMSWIRTEITSQLAQLGLATTEDLDALEARLSGRAGAASASKTAPAKKAGATRSTATKKAAPKKAATKKAATGKAAAKKAAPATPSPADASRKAPGRP